MNNRGAMAIFAFLMFVVVLLIVLLVPEIGVTK